MSLITAEQMRASRPFSRERRVDFEKLSDDVKWWIGGQMDGDGCVRVCPINGLTVRIGKAENAWHSLVHLQRFMGGAIYDCNRSREGNFQAERHWTLRGQAALDFCESMQRFMFLKQPQLVKALEFPLYGGWMAKMKPVRGTHKKTGETVVFASVSDAKRKIGITSINAYLAGKTTHAGGYEWEYIANPVKTGEIHSKRAELERIVSDLKRVEHLEIEAELPLPYVAGFVDADGCVRAGAVIVTQKYRAVCEAMQRQFGGGVYTSTREDGSSIFRWRSPGKAGALRIAALLLPYMIEKKAQVEIMLDVALSDAEKNRRMSMMKGHQGEVANAENRAGWREMVVQAMK